jgi:3-deoxy-D-manno-octulosonic-acid transferase
MTPTGAMRVKAALAESVIHAYLPYDLPCAMTRFLKAMQPRLAIIMETELWPNMLAACSEQKIPVCLLNARLSAQSANAYRRIAPLAHQMLQQVTVIAAQGAADAERFMQLGASASQVQLSGNLKFDLELPSDLAANAHLLHQSLSPDARMIWIAASTHEGEEEIILKAHQQIRKHISNALLILVPRHPDRFNVVAEQSQKIFVTVKRSEHLPCTAETAVYLGDTMGELLLLYGASDAAFVGGSLIPRGGHNLLEPAALAKPLLSGPHLFNFTEMRDLFLQARALRIVQDAASLAKQLLALMQDQSLRTQMGTAARQVLEANRGALDKQLQLITAYLPA